MKWQNLLEISLDVLVSWTKFLTVHINKTQNWACAKNTLIENENDYPTIINEKKNQNSLKLPDYINLMLNYKRFVKKKLKSFIF